jgi:hypothetical protein
VRRPPGRAGGLHVLPHAHPEGWSIVVKVAPAGPGGCALVEHRSHSTA